MDLDNVSPAIYDALFDYIVSKDGKKLFKKALEDGDRSLFSLLPKSDLHIHSSRGCSRKVFEGIFWKKFPDVPRFKSLEEMNKWYDETIDEYAKGQFGHEVRIRSMLKGFDNNSVVVASPIFCLRMKKYFDDSIYNYFHRLNADFELFAPNTKIYPEFEVCRGEDPEKVLKDLEEVCKFNFYKSIDLRGDENLGVKQYRDVYKKAHDMGLVLKAHVGEFGDASKIEEALEYLDLDCITHGNSLVESNDLMNYVRDNEIMVNCCPSSNYYLSRIDDYKNHPINKFVDKGIICSINTDDELIFNQSINDEYFNLYNSGCLGADELYEVNQNGINKCLSKRRR